MTTEVSTPTQPAPLTAHEQRRQHLLGFAGCACLSLSAFCAWLNRPLEGSVPAYRWGAFGVLTFLLGALALLPKVRRHSATTALLALLLLFLPARQLLFTNLKMTEALAEEARQKNDALDFDRSAVGGNVTPDLYFERIGTEDLLTRLDSLPSCLGWGWGLAGVGALLLGAHGWGRLKRKGLWAALIIGAMVALCWRPLAAELFRAHGDLHLARGRYAQAVEAYARARRWNSSLNDTAPFHEKLGKAYFELRQFRRADAHLYRGDEWLRQKEFFKAVDAYSRARAVTSPRTPEAVLRRKLARARAAWGLALFRPDRPNSAIAQWRQALEVDPEQRQVHFYLAHALYAARRYDEALRENETFLAHCKDRFLRGEVYTNVGECYFRQRRFAEARQMFQRALQQYTDVRLINFRARRALGGLSAGEGEE